MPAELGDIELYAGDPKTIVLRLANQDLSAHTFTAQYRHRNKDVAAIGQFQVSVGTVPNADDDTLTDTLITLFLAGDTEGNQDGLTRLPEGVRDAYFDVQEWDNGAAVQTIALGHLKQVVDVTR